MSTPITDAGPNPGMDAASIAAAAFGLNGRRVLVTGASSGIGAATALACAEMGAQVLLTGRNAERLDSVHCALPGEHPAPIAADLLTDEGIATLVAGALPLDGVVFSAGVAETVPLRQISAAHIERVMAVNFGSPVRLTQSLIRSAKIAKNASLVYVGAVADHIAPAGSAVYSASKGALASAVRSMALELARHGIRANTVSPGYVQTPMFDQVRARSGSVDDIVKLVPLGGVIDAVDVARGIVYLLSPASRWVTRSALVIDGGLTLPVR